MKKNGSFFCRLLVTFLLAFLVLFGLVMGVFFIYSKNWIQRSLQERIIQYAEEISIKFRSDYDHVLRSNLKMITDSPLFAEYEVAAGDEKAKKAEGIEDLFKHVIFHSQGVERVYYLNNGNGEENILVDKTGRVDWRHLNVSKDSQAVTKAADFDHVIVKGPYKNSDKYSISNGKNLIFLYIPQRRAVPEQGAGAVVVEYSLEDFLDYLTILKIEGEDVLWVLAPDGRVVKQPQNKSMLFDPRPYLPPVFHGSPKLLTQGQNIMMFQDLSLMAGKSLIRVVISVPAVLLWRDTKPVLGFFVFVFLLGAAIIFGCAYYLAHDVSRPIIVLSQAATRLAEGDWSTRVNVRATGEINTLVDSFNQMAAHLREMTQILREEKERLGVTLKSIGDGVISTDTESRIVLMNQVAEDLTGWRQEEALGQPLKNIFHIITQDTRQPCVDPVSSAIARGHVITLQNSTILISKNGHERVISDSCAPIKDNKGNICGAVLVFRDNTERRKKEDAIRKLSSAVEFSPVALFITDSKGVIEYVNPKFLQVSGYSREELVGVMPRILRPNHLPLEGYQRLWEMISSGKEWQGEFLNKKKNGEPYWESVSISSLKDAKGNITNFLIALEDITERKETEVALKRTMAVKEEFISTVSHELRTPLAISKEALSLLVRGKVGTVVDKQLEIVRMAYSNLERLAILINDILDVSKLESGKLDLYKEPVDVVSFVEENAKAWAISARVKKINLIFTVSQEKIVLMLDKLRFQQILSNLINNAIKFTPEGGRVGILVIVQKGWVEFLVTDTGPGIPTEDMPKLFQKFQQFQRAYRSGIQGTGLGLYIVHYLVNLHGGEITVESELGKGTTFKVTIPKTTISPEIPGNG